MVLLQLDVELPLSSVTSLNFHCSGTDSWLSGFITSAFGYGSVVCTCLSAGERGNVTP